MEFGINLRSIHESNRMAELAKQAEDNGFDYVYISDSQAIWRDVYANLALIADRTSTIRMGPGVTNPVTRHPMVTANAILTIDDISDGRAFLGFGRGGSAVRAIGMEDLPSFKKTEESIEIMRKFWAGERQDFEFRDTTTELHWTDGTDIPIYIAAAGPKMIKLAGRLGDGIMIAYVNYPPEVKKRVEHIREVESGETKKISYLSTSISDSRQYAYDLIRPMVAAYCDLAPNLAENCDFDIDLDKCKKLRNDVGDLTHATDWQKVKNRAEFVSDTGVKRMTLAGTPEELIDDVRDLERQGIDKLVIRPFFSHKFSDEDEFSLEYYLESFGETVIPEFK